MGFLAPVFSFIGAIFVGTSATGAYLVAVNIARLGLLALSAKLFAPKPDLSEVAVTKNLTIRDPIAPQSGIYGEDMISGPIVFSNVSGLHNRNLIIVIALTGHEIDSVQKYRIDSTDVALTDLSGAEDGDATGGKYNGVARVDLRKGTSTQSAVPNLTSTFPALFNAAHTGRGWSYMVWEFNLIEGQEDVFKTQPGNIRALIRGRKIYDPRLDTTNGGSGPHRLATPSTWEWSNNPALCLADFIRDDKFGMREEDDRVDWPMIITAADVCDELVAIPTASTQKRYTCNFTFSSQEARSRVRDELIGAMLGRMVFSQGLWKVWAGEAVTPDVTLTEANLSGGITLQASAPSQERYNRMRGKFIDPSRDYTAAAYVEQRSTVFETEDGGEVREKVADFTSTNSDFEAQRKAIVTLKQSRQQRVLVWEGNYSCFRIQPGTTVLLDVAELGFSGEKFFVTEWRLSDVGIQLTLVEEIDSAWTAPLEGDYSTRSETGVITFGQTGVPAPTALAAAPYDFGGVELTWTNPLINTFKHIEIWRSADNDRTNATLVGISTAERFIDQLPDVMRTRYYWIRAVGPTGQVSDWEPDTTTTTVQAFATIVQAPVVKDPFIRLGAGVWELSQSGGSLPTYEVGVGTKGTDVIEFAGSAISQTAAHAERRGDAEWDVEAIQGMTIEIRYRVKYSVAGTGGWTVVFVPIVRTSTETGTDIRQYGTSSGGVATFDENSTVGVWVEVSATIVLDQEVSHTNQPRFIQVLIIGDGNSNGAEYQLDMLEASVQASVFGGSAKIGLVPDASAATQATDFLRADGTWQVPAGGGGGIADGTVTGAMLRWDGFDWVEETTIQHIATRLDLIQSQPILRFEATGAAAGEKKTDIRQTSSGDWSVMAITDGGSNGPALMSGIRSATTWASLQFITGQVQISSAGVFSIKDPTLALLADFWHTTGDFIADFTGVADWQITGLTGNLDLRDGAKLILNDTTDVSQMDIGAISTNDFEISGGGSAGDLMFDAWTEIRYNNPLIRIAETFSVNELQMECQLNTFDMTGIGLASLRLLDIDLVLEDGGRVTTGSLQLNALTPSLPDAVINVHNDGVSQWQLQMQDSDVLQWAHVPTGDIHTELSSVYGFGIKDAHGFRMFGSGSETQYATFQITATTAALGRLSLTGVNNIDKFELSGMSLYLIEQASANEDIASRGQFWVRLSDNAPMYTGEDSVDHNLLDSGGLDGAAAETITGAWNFDTTTIDFLTGTQIRIWEAAGIDSLLIRDNGVNAVYSRINGIHTFSQGIFVSGDVSGTTIGGITEANLVNKAATETITGSWTFNDVATLRLLDNDQLQFGSSQDVSVDWDSAAAALIFRGAATNQNVRFYDGMEVRAYDESEANYTAFAFDAGAGWIGTSDAVDPMQLRTGGVARINALNEATTGNMTGGSVKDGNSDFRPIGLGIMPIREQDSAYTLDKARHSNYLHRDAAGSIDYTCPNSSAIQNGTSWFVSNENASGTFRIKGASGVTVRHFTGAAVDSVTAGNGFTLALGASCVIVKYANAEYHLFGKGLTES